MSIGSDFGNNLRIESEDSEHLYISRNVTEPHFNLDIPLTDSVTVLKMTFEGDFLIAVVKNDEDERKMIIYKCYNEEVMKFVGAPTPAKSKYYYRSIDCKELKRVDVNSFVNLVDAKDLKDFLVVRFKSENSVVYYKFNKFDYSSIEINLKGYSPAMVWMAQMQANRIIICHYKKSSMTPLTLFALDGENLAKIPDPPNIDQYRSVSGLQFKAGSLIEEDGAVFLYLAIVYPNKISYLKFSLPANSNDSPILSKSSHELFEELGIDFSESEICFLRNMMFIAIQKFTITELEGELIRTTSAYLVDLNNPNLDYKYPLQDFGLTNLTDISVTCHTDTNVIILKGVIDHPNERISKNVYLNGNFEYATNRVLQIQDGFNHQNCLTGFTKNFISELCTGSDPQKKQQPKFWSRLISVKNKFNIYLEHGETNQSHTVKMIAGNKTELFEFMSITQGKEYPERISINSEFRNKFENLAQLPEEDRQPLEKFDLMREIIPDYSGHVLKASIKINNNDPTKLNGISMIERVILGLVIKKNMSMDIVENGTLEAYPNIDSAAAKDNFVASLTITTKYQNLNTWISIYDFDYKNITNIRRVGRFEVKDQNVKNPAQVSAQVCKKFHFDYYNTTDNVTNLVTTHFLFVVVCNEGVQSKQLLYYFAKHGNGSTSITPVHMHPPFISAAEPVEVISSLHKTSDTEVNFFITSSFFSKLRISPVRCLILGQSLNCSENLPLIGDDSYSRLDLNDLYPSYRQAFTYPFGEEQTPFGVERNFYIILLLDQAIMAAKFDPLNRILNETDFFNISVPDYDTDPGTHIRDHKDNWPNYLKCKQEPGHLRCAGVGSNPQYIVSFVLYEDQKDTASPIKISNFVAHKGIPDCIDENPELLIIDGFISVDNLLISSTGRKKIILLYKTPPFNIASTEVVAVQNKPEYIYAWYSIDKGEYFNDLRKKVQLFAFEGKKQAGDKVVTVKGLLMNSDKEDKGLVVLYLNEKIELLVARTVRAEDLERASLQFNYEEPLDIIPAASIIERSKMWLWLLLSAIGICLLSFLIYFVWFSIKAVRRPRQPTYIRNRDTDLMIHLDQSLGGPSLTDIAS